MHLLRTTYSSMQAFGGVWGGEGIIALGSKSGGNNCLQKILPPLFI